MVKRRAAGRHAGTWIVLACLLIGAVAWLAPRRRDELVTARPAAVADSAVRADDLAELELAGARTGRSLNASLPLSLAADEPAHLPQRDRAERKEREAYDTFVAEERRAPGSLDARATEIFAATTSTAVKLAFVRARLDEHTPGRLEGVLSVVRSMPDGSTPKGESLAEAAVRFLGATAKEDPEVRNMVRRIAFEEQPIASQVRIRAAAAFARVASGADLDALERHLAAETDSRLLASALHGLAENPDVPAARRVAEQLGLALPSRGEESEP
jgi:hypothetical protein